MSSISKATNASMKMKRTGGAIFVKRTGGAISSVIRRKFKSPYSSSHSINKDVPNCGSRNVENAKSSSVIGRKLKSPYLSSSALLTGFVRQKTTSPSSSLSGSNITKRKSKYNFFPTEKTDDSRNGNPKKAKLSERWGFAAQGDLVDPVNSSRESKAVEVRPTASTAPKLRLTPISREECSAILKKKGKILTSGDGCYPLAPGEEHARNTITLKLCSHSDDDTDVDDDDTKPNVVKHAVKYEDGSTAATVILGRQKETGIKCLAISRELCEVSLAEKSSSPVAIMRMRNHALVHLDGELVRAPLGEEIPLTNGSIIALFGDTGFAYHVDLVCRKEMRDLELNEYCGMAEEEEEYSAAMTSDALVDGGLNDTALQRMLPCRARGMPTDGFTHEQRLIVGSSWPSNHLIDLTDAARHDVRLDDYNIDDDDNDDNKRPDDDDDDGDGGDDRKRPARVTASPTSLVARAIGPVDEALVTLASGPIDGASIRERLILGERCIDFSVDEPCPDDACRDPTCQLGHSCKCCGHHKSAGRVFPASCFEVRKGNRLLSCLEKSQRSKIENAKRAELRKVDLLAFLEMRANIFRNSSSHNWSAKLSPLVSLVFVLQLAKWYIAYPNTPFKVTSTTFSVLRERDDNKLEATKESLLEKLDFSALRCWYTGMMPTIGSHGGHTMLSIDQGNPSLKSDAAGQTWYICTWWSNKYKINMRPKEFRAHMDHLSTHYSATAADEAYQAYVRGDVVRVSSSLTYAENKLKSMRKSHREGGRIECGYTSINDVTNHCRQMGNGCLITGIPYNERVFPLSLDRMTDDLHHNSDDCHLIGEYLNGAKGEHEAFKSREALAAYCREHSIDESGSEHDKICKIIRPIIIMMIERWQVIRPTSA